MLAADEMAFDFDLTFLLIRIQGVRQRRCIRPVGRDQGNREEDDDVDLLAAFGTVTVVDGFFVSLLLCAVGGWDAGAAGVVKWCILLYILPLCLG